MAVAGAWIMFAVYPFYVYQLYIHRAVAPEPKLTWWQEIMAFIEG